MVDYKLLVLDVDGTLIGQGAYPSSRVAEAIAAAKVKGITVLTWDRPGYGGLLSSIEAP